jgi:formate dehydrogenase
LANRRNRHSMNSWLNELPGLHRSGKRNDVVIHPDDAKALGISDGDLVKVYSPVGEIELSASVDDCPRRGVIVVDHGWGSRFSTPVAVRNRSPTARTATCSSTAGLSTRCRRRRR